MRKPRMSDYGLNQKIIEVYNDQLTQYSRLKQRIEEENKVYNRNLALFIVPLVILALVVFVSIIQQSESPMEVLAYVWVCHTLAVTFVWYLGDDEDSGIVAVLLASILASVCLPFISLGICAFLSFARNKTYISREYPKQKYVDVSIGEQIDAYSTAIQEYNEWKEKSSKSYWIHMSGYQFEDAIARLYEKKGYRVEQTSYSSDGGVDIILFKEERKSAVQCKHHAKPVGPNDVRALMGVVASRNFDEGIFVSLNGFTSTVYYEVEHAKIPIKLISLSDILSMVKSGDERFDECEENTIRSKETSTTLSKANNRSGQRGHIANEKNLKPPVKTEQNENLVLQQEKTEKVIKKCTGNCSTCEREYCIEDN